MFVRRVNFTSAARPLPNLRRGHKMKFCIQNHARSGVHKLKKSTFYFAVEGTVMPVPTSRWPEELEFVVDPGASMYMLSKMNPSSNEMDTLRRPRTPQRCERPTGKFQKRKHKYTFTILISSWQCKCSM